MGDTLWATPAIESLKRSFPSSSVVVLTSPIGQEVLQNNPWIDEIWLFRPSLSLFLKLKKKAFDVALVLHSSQRLLLPFLTAAGIPEIVGTLTIQKGLDALLTDPLPRRPMHEIRRRLEMVELIGGSSFTEILSIYTPRVDPPSRPLICLHPGSKDPFRRYPASLYAEVGRLFKQHLDCDLIVTGHEEADAVAAGIPGAKTFQGSFTALASLLSQASLLITNDTGPFHLACALPRPAIGLFVPSDPFLFGPHKSLSGFALKKPATCTPCLKRRCPEPFCFYQIGPKEIVEKGLQMLTNVVD
jgi:ADP-heptose:LPS heptosyltransferase